MGFFSHRCSISNESIPAFINDGSRPFLKQESEVMLFLPNGEVIEGTYDGYGRILTDEQLDLSYGEIQDIPNLMSLVPKAMNDMAFIPDDSGGFSFKEILDNIHIVKKKHYDSHAYEDLLPSPSCDYQGFFYPNNFNFELDARNDLANRGVIPQVIES